MSMNTMTLILFIAFLVIGFISFSLIGGTYWYIIIKHKKVDSVFYFWEYATKKELLLIKSGAIGIVVCIVLFIVM